MSEEKKPTKITDYLKTKTWLKTSECYCKALKEFYPEVLKGFDDRSFKELGADREMRIELAKHGLDSRPPEIHRLYMKHVLQLPSRWLELVIEADRQNITRRAPGTIDEIMYELLDRAVKDSETKGDV